MTFSGKIIFFIALLYGIIVAGANVIGVIIPNIFTSNDLTHGEMDGWIQFLNNSPTCNWVQYMTFLVPTFFCIMYVFSRKEKKISHFINLPIAYSTIGISGWISYFILELFYIRIAISQGYVFNVADVLKTSILNLAVEATVTFSLSFFVTETVHRKYVLPKYFSEGNLSRYTGTKYPKVRFLFIVNYVSVTLFPVIFLSTLILSLQQRFDFHIDTKSFYMLVVILAIGIAISILLNTYFSKPLEKIKDRIEKIKEGDYTSKINFVANDSFGELADTLNDMTESIESKTKKILEIQNSIIEGMATMVESRDNSTGGHIKRTSSCVKIFAEHLKKVPEYKDIPESFYNAVIKAAPMHDLGKIAVDDAILRKPGKFTDEEYEKMKAHSAEGARIVENVLSSTDDIEFKKIAVNVAHYHHEKWNGQGYPEKISRTDIPLEARIMALADVFDALVSKRCYKDNFSFDKAFQIIEEDLGTHFDPVLGLEFIKCRPELEKLYS
ncbi:HD-GYP domain-containing protein [Treponema sp.]|uniref:HD-GYP domain-containing protein n=1 Tax=Treponema sp. TaxID=166 RepID=UPI00388FA3E0